MYQPRSWPSSGKTLSALCQLKARAFSSPTALRVDASAVLGCVLLGWGRVPLCPSSSSPLPLLLSSPSSSSPPSLPLLLLSVHLSAGLWFVSSSSTDVYDWVVLSCVVTGATSNSQYSKWLPNQGPDVSLKQCLSLSIMKTSAIHSSTQNHTVHPLKCIWL